LIRGLLAPRLITYLAAIKSGARARDPSKVWGAPSPERYGPPQATTALWLAPIGRDSFDRIGFPAYQGNNREIRGSGRAHHRIYVEKTVYLSYFESNSLRTEQGIN